ncbi:MAG: dUTP diphosphatase [Candidatus Paceibacterota bacterium]
MKVKIKKLTTTAMVPTYATRGSACFDIYADSFANIFPGEADIIRTALAFEIPAGYVLKIYSRSGHGFKNGIRLANGTGIIDSDYRGELQIKLHNDGTERFEVEPGYRIAQGMLEKVEQVQFKVVAELSETERGKGGFGSSGK